MIQQQKLLIRDEELFCDLIVGCSVADDTASRDTIQKQSLSQGCNWLLLRRCLQPRDVRTDWLPPPWGRAWSETRGEVKERRSERLRGETKRDRGACPLPTTLVSSLPQSSCALVFPSRSLSLHSLPGVCLTSSLTPSPSHSHVGSLDPSAARLKRSCIRGEMEGWGAPSASEGGLTSVSPRARAKWSWMEKCSAQCLWSGSSCRRWSGLSKRRKQSS